MAISNPVIRSIALTTDSSNDCLNKANQLLSRTSVDSMFVTVLYGIFNLETGEIDFTNAGHNPTYILRKDGEVEKVPQHSNFVLGAFEDFIFQPDTTHLDHGDSIVLYTDGVTEAFNADEEEFGEKRLHDTLKGLKQESAEGIIKGILKEKDLFVGETEQSDDITMLVLKRL